MYWEDAGVPAWAGVEYMAQTIAAHAGVEARARGEPPAIGFLLGTRAYSTSVEKFPNGSKLTVTVEPENPMSPPTRHRSWLDFTGDGRYLLTTSHELTLTPVTDEDFADQLLRLAQIR